MRRFKGLTLLELLVALVICIILSAIAIPRLSQLSRKLVLDSCAHSIWRSLAKAREAAVVQGTHVAFCGLNREGECANSGITTFIAFVDTNSNDRWDSTDPLIFQHNIKYAGTILVEASNPLLISFNADGSSHSFGNVTLCPADKDKRSIRRIAVNRAGRSYLLPDRDGDGVVEDADHTPVACAQFSD